MAKNKFLEKYCKVPVEEYPNEVSKSVLVSVCVQTYNQEMYIEKCLNGILQQKTGFDFEILIGEDASSDSTRNICIEYAKKYPKKIRLFLHHRENNITFDNSPTAIFNYKYNVYNAKGKYLAICEGDDYWIDPLKLQKQITFLEKNKDYGMVFSDIVMIDKDNKEIPETNFHNKIRKLYKSGNIFLDLVENNFINTLTTCTRKSIILDYINRFSTEDFTYDYRKWLHVATHYKIKFVDEKWAAYRNHQQGVSRNTSFFRKRTPLVLQAAIIHYLDVNKNTKIKIDKNVVSSVLFRIILNKNLSIKEKKPAFKIIIKEPSYSINILFFILKKFKSKKIIK